MDEGSKGSQDGKRREGCVCRHKQGYKMRSIHDHFFIYYFLCAFFESLSFLSTLHMFDLLTPATAHAPACYRQLRRVVEEACWVDLGTLERLSVNQFLV